MFNCTTALTTDSEFLAIGSDELFLQSYWISWWSQTCPLSHHLCSLQRKKIVLQRPQFIQYEKGSTNNWCMSKPLWMVVILFILKGRNRTSLLLFIVYYDRLSFITPTFCTNSCANFARNYSYNTVITVYGCVDTISELKWTWTYRENTFLKLIFAMSRLS